LFKPEPGRNGRPHDVSVRFGSGAQNMRDCAQMGVL